MDRRQNSGSVKAVSLAIAQRLVHCAIAVSTAVLGQSHKDSGRCTAVEEQPEAKEVQLCFIQTTGLIILRQKHTQTKKKKELEELEEEQEQEGGGGEEGETGNVSGARSASASRT